MIRLKINTLSAYFLNSQLCIIIGEYDKVDNGVLKFRYKFNIC